MWEHIERERERDRDSDEEKKKFFFGTTIRSVRLFLPTTEDEHITFGISFVVCCPKINENAEDKIHFAMKHTETHSGMSVERRRIFEGVCVRIAATVVVVVVDDDPL